MLPSIPQPPLLETTVLLVRVEDRRGLSHLHVARSLNGLDQWTLDPVPAMSPIEDDPYSAWGFEDARAVWVQDLERFAVTCTAYGPVGPSVHLAFTTNFVAFEHLGTVMPPADKNAALFPRRINGMWVMLHRPITGNDRRADVGCLDPWTSSAGGLLSR